MNSKSCMPLNLPSITGSLERGLNDPPLGLLEIDLGARSLGGKSPDEFLQISRMLSRWPIITIADAEALLSYLYSGRKLSIVDPDGGIFGELLTSFQAMLGLRRGYGLTFNAGTSALYAAYRALGVAPGVIVAAPAYTFHATVTSVLEMGADLRLMDVSPIDGNVTLEAIQQTVESTPSIKVVSLNHNWGFPVSEIAHIRDYLSHRRIRLLEDCSHAHGATVRGEPVGAFGDISVFSLQAHKAVTSGEGGIGFTDDPELYQRMRLVGHPDAGMQSSAEISVEQTGLHGLKFRMHVLGAVLALSQIDRFAQVLANRRANAAYIAELLMGHPCVDFVPVMSEVNPSYYSIRPKYVTRSGSNLNVAALVSSIRSQGVDVGRDRFMALSHASTYQRTWQEFDSQALRTRKLYKPGDFPVAESFRDNRLIFPVFSRNPSLVRGTLEVMAERIIAACEKLEIAH